MTPWAAKWADCCDEPHWRSMVVAGTDSGKPAASTALRPMLSDLGADLHDAAHDHVVDEGGVEVVALDERLEDLGGEVGRVPARELAVALAAGGADGVDDDCGGHVMAPLLGAAGPSGRRCPERQRVGGATVGRRLARRGTERYWLSPRN